MSTPSTPRSQHPLPLRDQAFQLFCAGQRSPAIAQQLGVPERTIRAWLAAIQQQLSDERTGTSQAAAALAEARQLQIAAAAWESYRRHAAAEQQQLDDLQYATHEELDTHPPRLTATGARYLALAQRATALASKFAGAYTCPPPKPEPVNFYLLEARRRPQDIQPPQGPNAEPLSGLALERYQHDRWVRGLQEQINSDQELVAQGRARLAELNALLAPTPAPIPDDPDDLDGDDDGEEQGDRSEEHVAGDPAATRTANPAESDITATGDAEFPAESATALAVSSLAFMPSSERAPAFQGRDPAIPAETATTPDTGLAAGLQPANPTPPPTSPSIATSQAAAPLSPQGEGPGVRTPSWTDPHLPDHGARQLISG